MCRLHPVFPIVKLTPARPNPFPGIIDDHKEYEVEKVLDSKILRRKVHYLDKWKGYGIAENSWEPAANLHAPGAIANFYRSNPCAPRQINRLSFDNI
jgi:hypothetical protein